jgi:hypothetical protein
MRCPFRANRRVMAKSAGFYASQFGGGSADDEEPDEVIEAKPIDGCECISFARRLWRFQEVIQSTWTVGPCDASRRSRNRWPTHAHTNFDVAGQEVHVDYMTDRSGGPLCALCEFQVYVDGRHAGKGGLLAMPPAGVYRNWPLAVRLGSGLLITREFGPYVPHLNDFAGMSLWKAAKRPKPTHHRDAVA